MVLASNEAKIKEWEYGSVRVGNQVTQSTLTVTNKRIIKTERNANRLDQQEIPLDTVKSIHCTHEVPSKLSAILKIIFGVVFIIVGVLLLFAKDASIAQMIPMFAALCLIGIILLAVGIKQLNQGVFFLVITTIGVEGQPLEAGFVKWFKKAGKGGKIKIKINNFVIADMIESLGAIITEYRR
jgi:hypothetical protein